ncbi:probable vacuolar amino acid transporter YPQ1 [Salvia splendens]|uniref:probable vacuolar amino acid transporter YPQ1 n=1 Tax=Salvia splendens TaxID=180675 RepID=UPI001C26D921|nr:probable vacuolar amino acid transporter YPQ1 [Salvia splendens]XP_042025191.1 probable vacuolar amino acid transporter YPQ1 [Salvia splendens]
MRVAAQNTVSYCVEEEKACIGWVEKYFKDCLCNTSDQISFGFGIISLLCWGVAEIPQIITNFRTKSGHGISIFFLLTWVLGDIFNLMGCLLEPATLPTQFYTAALYTVSTVVLVIQSFYYDYYLRWPNVKPPKESHTQVDEELKKPLRPTPQTDSPIPIPTRGEAYYYASARSMAASTTPPIRMRSYLWPIKSGPSAVGIANNSSPDSEARPIPSRNGITKPKPIPRSAGFGAFFATSISMPRETNALVQVYLGLSGRKMLQLGLNQEDGSESVFGQWLGWMMAAIYMGGRLPQIWLNIKRGSVEGLNPLMFIFALAANAAYVASILVRSTAWDKIRANLPWLLDAAVCVLLDLFIIFQYVYYRYYRRERRCNGEDYTEATK